MNKIKLVKYINIIAFISWLIALITVILVPNRVDLQLTSMISIALVLMRIGFDILECKVIK